MTVSRRTLLAGTGAAVAASTAGTDAAAAARRVAQPPEYRNAIELIGTIIQTDDTLTAFGWVTHVAGLADASLFTDPAARQEPQARLTWHAEAGVTARSLIGEVASVTGEGRVRFFNAPSGGAQPGVPDSFTTGRLVARHRARLRARLSIFAPDRAITEITGELRQVETHAFRLGGTPRRLGHTGLRQRLEASGLGARTVPNAQRATFHVAGGLVIPG